MEMATNSSESLFDQGSERRILKQGLTLGRNLFKRTASEEAIKTKLKVNREQYKLEQMFLMHAVSDNGKQLWKSLMIERQRILVEMPSLVGKYLQRNIMIPQ
jgi:hypothetical protein